MMYNFHDLVALNTVHVSTSIEVDFSTAANKKPLKYRWRLDPFSMSIEIFWHFSMLFLRRIDIEIGRWGDTFSKRWCYKLVFNTEHHRCSFTISKIMLVWSSLACLSNRQLVLLTQLTFKHHDCKCWLPGHRLLQIIRSIRGWTNGWCMRIHYTLAGLVTCTVAMFEVALQLL